MEGGLLIAIPLILHWGMVPRVLQITENELCREHRNHIKKKHFHDHQENVCVLLCFQSFLVCAKQFFFLFFNDQSYIYSSSFQKYSRTSVENSRTFQGMCEKRIDGKWSLAESFFKQRYCNVVTHGSLLSYCITSLYHSKFEIAPKLSI